MHIPPPDSLFFYELVRYWAFTPNSGDWMQYLPYEIFRHDLRLPVLESLLEHLRRGEDCVVGASEFERREDYIYWLGTPYTFHEPAATMIAQIEALQAFCMKVKAAGVTPENGLMAFFDYSDTAQCMVLNYLACSQVISDPDVKKCWEEVIIFITDTLRWGVNTVEEARTSVKGGGSIGYDGFGFDPYSDVVDSYSPWESCSCSRWGLLKALDILLQHFYDAI